MRLGSMVQDIKASEATRNTVKAFLVMLDHFHSSAQKLSAAGMVGYQLTQHDNGGTTPSGEILDALYFQISLIAFLYGLLGLCVFFGVMGFAHCTGRAKQIGWKPIVLENLSGSRLPHFFAHLCCVAGGIVGFVSPSLRSNKNLPLVLPVLMLLSSILNGTAKSEEKKPDSPSDNAASFHAGHFFTPHRPDRRNAISDDVSIFGQHVQSRRKPSNGVVRTADSDQTREDSADPTSFVVSIPEESVDARKEEDKPLPRPRLRVGSPTEVEEPEAFSAFSGELIESNFEFPTMSVLPVQKG